MEKDLISIVVPIYNIENYVEKCVRSIINQTYINLEILLVIDGATDNSEKICKKIDDPRIKVLVKKNGGLSDARNYGLKLAKGKYIIFIDGDDFINENMVEILYNNLLANNADISVCSFQFFYEDGTIKDYYEHIDENEVLIMNQEEALLSIIDNSIAFKQNAWNKLYKKSLFDKIEYPYGKLYEDMGTTYKVILNSNRIVYTHKNLYYYVQRGNSITKTFKFNSRELDRIEMADWFCDTAINVYPKHKYNFLKFKILQYIAVSNVMIRNNCKDSELIKRTKNCMKGNIIGILKYGNFKERMQIILYYINFSLYKWIFKKCM